MLRPQDKRTSFTQGNQLGKRNQKEQNHKIFTFPSGKHARATRVIVKADELEVKTAIHPLNPRRQASLSLEAVRDILPTIQVEGVHTEGVAVKDAKGKYLLLDSSRRRFCCLYANKELPLWVIEDDVEAEDLVSYILTTQSVKRLSYRELGAKYDSIMKRENFTKLESLAEFLHIGRETCRKRLVAANVSQQLIDLFPDCEGIPNSFYAKLAKIEKQLAKENSSVEYFVSSLLNEIEPAQDKSIEEKQRQILTLMERKLSKKSYSPTWTTKHLKEFSDKNKYAKVSHSQDKRGLKIELNRLSPDIYEDILRYITNKVMETTKHHD